MPKKKKNPIYKREIGPTGNIIKTLRNPITGTTKVTTKGVTKKKTIKGSTTYPYSEKWKDVEVTKSGKDKYGFKKTKSKQKRGSKVTTSKSWRFSKGGIINQYD